MPGAPAREPPQLSVTLDRGRPDRSTKTVRYAVRPPVAAGPSVPRLSATQLAVAQNPYLEVRHGGHQPAPQPQQVVAAAAAPLPVLQRVDGELRHGLDPAVVLLHGDLWEQVARGAARTNQHQLQAEVVTEKVRVLTAQLLYCSTATCGGTRPGRASVSTDPQYTAMQVRAQAAQLRADPHSVTSGGASCCAPLREPQLPSYG